MYFVFSVYDRMPFYVLLTSNSRRAAVNNGKMSNVYPCECTRAVRSYLPTPIIPCPHVFLFLITSGEIMVSLRFVCCFVCASTSDQHVTEGFSASVSTFRPKIISVRKNGSFVCWFCYSSRHCRRCTDNAARCATWKRIGVRRRSTATAYTVASAVARSLPLTHSACQSLFSNTLFWVYTTSSFSITTLIFACVPLYRMTFTAQRVCEFGPKNRSVTKISICPSVYLSHADIVSKRTNASRNFLPPVYVYGTLRKFCVLLYRNIITKCR